MDIASQTKGRAVIITVQGEIDGKTAPELHAAVAPQVPRDGAVLLDMSEVRYMSSAGLRMLLLLHRDVSAKKARLVLVGLPEELRETMALTGFDQHFSLCDTQEDGLASLR